jgi:alkaline phosphatase D
MKTSFFSSSVAFIAVAATVILSGCSKNQTEPTPAPQQNELQSHFTHDAEGWTIVGDAQGGFVAASYAPDGGISDGYIFANDDVTGGTWYFSAPDTYLGDKTTYYNATLKFSLFQHSDMNDQFDAADIVLKNNDQQIVFRLNNFPGTDWTSYHISINETSGWLKGDYNSQIPATKADIEEVLSNITSFLIRGEYQTGPDEGGLDNMEIVR